MSVNKWEPLGLPFEVVVNIKGSFCIVLFSEKSDTELVDDDYYTLEENMKLPYDGVWVLKLQEMVMYENNEGFEEIEGLYYDILLKKCIYDGIGKNCGF